MQTVLPIDPALNIETARAYMVGGSVRDLILGRPPSDMDIAVADNPQQYAQKLARRVKGHLFHMGKAAQRVFRVVAEDRTFDILSINGETIEQDLRQRDFTINALAYCLSTQTIIDVTNGMKDLSDKTVRMVSPRAFENDPLRMVRAYRMAAYLGFQISPETAALVKRDARLIRKTAGERIRTELMMILNTPESCTQILQMSKTGLLTEVFPELKPLKGCGQHRHHRFDVWDHTFNAYGHLEEIFKKPERFFPADPSVLASSEKSLLKLALLLHDIGKPPTRRTDALGRVRFYGHGRKGAELAEGICRRLKFSNRDRTIIVSVVRHHLRPLFLFTAHQKGTLTAKGLTRFFAKTHPIFPALRLHTLADILGKGDSPDDQHAALIRFVQTTLNDAFAGYAQRKAKPPLVTGKDLIKAFGLKPSPLFRKILKQVEEARLSGEITSREEALRRVRGILTDS